MNNSELTVIVSNYNQEEKLAETIESVLSQIVDFKYSIIITDDYSLKDKSRDIIRKYSEKYSNIYSILSDVHGGYLANILRAKARTKTKYFCLLDAEDYWTDTGFLQRAYDFLNSHDEYTIYEANALIKNADFSGKESPFISPKVKAGTFSKEMLLKGEYVPITQTTGMVFRNIIYRNGIPDIVRSAIGTRSERSFEGETGRFFMHLRDGLAFYDDSVVGVYSITDNGIWSSLKSSQKKLITARSYLDYYEYYKVGLDFFVTKAYDLLQIYYDEKKKEIEDVEDLSEKERLMIEDVSHFCADHKNEIKRMSVIKAKIRSIRRAKRE